MITPEDWTVVGNNELSRLRQLESAYMIVYREDMYRLLTSEDLYHLKRIKDKLETKLMEEANGRYEGYKPQGSRWTDQSPDVVDPSGQQDS
jgi:hypothetical protein